MSNNKVALITGAARRIGAYLAKQLHTNGYNVIIHYYQSKEAAEMLCQDCLKKRANSAVILQADLNKIDALSSLINQAQTSWNRLDLLINNASRFYPTHVGQTTENQWDDLMKTNLTAPYFLTQAAFPYLQSVGGSVVNISDAHHNPRLNYSVYSIAKAGLNFLTKSLAIELAPRVRVNAIAPGPTIWPEGPNKLINTDRKNIIIQTPLKQKGDTKAIAQALFFLIENNHITGEIIKVDGGKSLGSC